MAKIKLTKSAVDAAQPQDKAIELRDTVVPGFLCKVTPAGRKVFMLQYRTNAGERRKPALGQYGELTVDQARTMAQEWLAGIYRRSVMLASGRDAMLDDGMGFSLVPWKPVIEQRLGQQLVPDNKILFCNTPVNQLLRGYPQTAMTLKFCSRCEHLAEVSDIKVLFPCRVTETGRRAEPPCGAYEPKPIVLARSESA